MTLHIVQNESADNVLTAHPFALICGMVLLQDAPVDVAFGAPATILERFGSLEPAAVAAAPEEDFAAVCIADPPIHPYAESMALLVQAAARYVTVNYGGDTAAIWETAGSGEHLQSRLMLVPGLTRRKVQMFVALLGKQLGVRPDGWEQVAAQYAEPDAFRSVADVRDPESLERVKRVKSAGRDEDGDGEDVGVQKPGRRSGHKGLTESRGTQHVETEGMTEEDATTEAAPATASETAEDGAQAADANPERGARRKAKREANQAKRAANKERRRAEEAADPELAAQRAEKRAARQAAKAEGGDTGSGKNNKNKNRRNRRRNKDQGESAAASTDQSVEQAPTDDF